MKLFHLILLTFFLNIASAQRVQVLAADSKQPISFATLLLVKNGVAVGGGYADEKGFCKLESSKGADEVRISALGFQTLILSITAFKDQVFMAPKAIQLDEVAINSKRKAQNKNPLIGIPFSGKTIYIGASVGFEMIDHLHKVNSNPQNIISFTFSYKIDCPEHFKAAFRVVFYEAKENGKPDSIASQQVSQVFFLSKGKQKNQKLDLSGLGFKMASDNFYAGIEWLGFVNELTGEFSDMEWKQDEFYAGISFVARKTEKPDLYIRSKFGNQNWTDFMDEETRMFYGLGKDEYIEPAFQIELSD